MKNKYIFFLFVFISITSCDKAPDDGDLYGMWQLMKIEYQDKPAVSPDQLYYCMQLHLISLQGANGGVLVGTYTHQGDSINIIIRRSSKNDVARFGMNDTIQSFYLDNLSRKEMTFHSDYARLQFRKF